MRLYHLRCMTFRRAWFRPCMITDFLFLSYLDSLVNPPSLSVIFYIALFRQNVNIAVLANKSSTARDILSRLQLAYENLPKWMQQGIIAWNKGNIELENGSKIIATCYIFKCNSRGSYNVIFLDEFCFLSHRMLQNSSLASVYPTITSGQSTKVIIVSTPHGMNMFYKIWVDAQEKRNDYIPIDVHWSEVPGRDEEWKKETIRNTSESQFNSEFECEFSGFYRHFGKSSKTKTIDI